MNPTTSSTATILCVDAGAADQMVSKVAEDLSTLMRQELELAKTEVKQEAARAGKAGASLGGAGLAGWLAILFLSLTAMFALGNVMDLGWAALIVTVGLGLAGTLLALNQKPAGVLRNL